MKKLLIYSLVIFMAISCTKNNYTDGGTPAPTPTPVPTPVIPPALVDSFVKGGDVSWVTEMEASGIKFYNNAGLAQECMSLLQSLGMNTIRLRVWVNPADGYNNTADVVAKAVRAKNLGMRILIDFHYSDSWADPGKQNKPAAWATQDFATLKTSLATHTTAVLTALKNSNVTPEWVQVGNETNTGMLWPDGKSAANYAQLVSAGYDAVKGVFPKAKVVVHISNGYDNVLFRRVFDSLTFYGVKYDVIGMSLYPNATNWATYNTQIQANMNDMVARFNKEVMVVEIGMSWDNTSSNAILKDLIAKTRAVTGGKGLGVIYWEPQSYNNWKGYTLGAFDNAGKPTSAMNAFSN